MEQKSQFSTFYSCYHKFAEKDHTKNTMLFVAIQFVKSNTTGNKKRAYSYATTINNLKIIPAKRFLTLEKLENSTRLPAVQNS